MAFKRTTRTYTEPELYECAIAALGRRMRTVAEMKRLLRQRTAKQDRVEADAMIESVVARLKEHKYLNDTQYATSYSNYRRENERLGRMRVVTDLRTKGVHSDVIDQAVAGAYEGVDEEQLAREFLGRKRVQKPADEKQAARVFRMLARAGFRTATAVRILKKWDVSDELLTAFETEES